MGAAFTLMFYGLGTVFAALLLFYGMIVLLIKFCKDEGKVD